MTIFCQNLKINRQKDTYHYKKMRGKNKIISIYNTVLVKISNSKPYLHDLISLNKIFNISVVIVVFLLPHRWVSH